jgi:hypothetical protein
MTQYFAFEEEKNNNSFPVFYPNNNSFPVFYPNNFPCKDDLEYENNNQIYNEKEFFQYFKYAIDSINENNDCSTASENNHNDSKNECLDINNSNIDQVKFPIESSKILFELKKRKRPGHKIIKESNNKKKTYVHTRNKFDNIATKIQVSYINFLIDFINNILYSLNMSDLKFYNLDANFKKENNTIKKRQALKEKSIGDIIKTEISSKYTSLDKNSNSMTYEKIKNNGLNDVMEILNQKYIFFFDKVYYRNLRIFNLKEFGLMDLEIKLPNNIELYENVLIKNNKNLNFEKYKNKIEQCVKKHFLGGLEEELLQE